VWGQRLNQLNDAQRQEIWLRSDEGTTNRELARRYGVSDSTISRIVRDRRQRRNVRTVADEEETKAASGGITGEEHREEAGPSRELETALAERRERKSGRPSPQKAGH
jgi:IS30 family transposase